jgi:3-isopropylmalate dehydratase small subunit
MNDNINTDSIIGGSMNDNINTDSIIAGSMNDNINQLINTVL